ncbi:MAG: hypothetical protein HKN73_14505 [Gemmatimonadetes bacterium]|nr:hypothetical protein [Gemmatimonadota bacterium]
MNNLSRAVLFLLVLAHLLLHVGMGFGRGAPDLFLVATLVAGRLTHVGVAAGLGFALGLMEDAFSVLSFGSNAFALAVTGIAAARSRDLFVGDSTLFLFSYFFIGKWARDVLSWLVSNSTVRDGFVEHLMVSAPLAGAYAALVGIVVVVVLRTKAGGWE